MGPVWVYCPARPFSPSPLRLFFSLLPLLLLPLLLFFGFALSLCAWLASSPTSHLASPTFFPSVASLGILSGSPLLATLCSILSFYLILLSSPPLPLSSFLSPLSILHLLPASSPPLKVFAQSGSAQCGNTLRTYDPKWSLAAMSGAFSRWRRLWSSYVFSRLSYFPPMLLVPPMLLDAADRRLLYYIVSWYSPHHWMSNLFFQCTYFANLCSSLFWRVDNETTGTFTGGEGNGVTSLWHTVRLVLLSSPISSPFIYFRTPPHVPRLPTPFSPYFSFALPHTSRPGLSTETFYPSVCPPTHFLFLQILLMISPGLPRCTSLLRLLLPSSLHIKIINSHPCYHSPSLITPTSPHSFTFLWILPSRWAFCCHHFEPLLE